MSRRSLNLCQNKPNENHDDNSDVHPGRDDLHIFLCGGKTKLQKDPQELSDERQEGMQLR